MKRRSKAAPRERRRTGIVLSCVWVALCLCWLGLYLFRDAQWEDFLLGELTSLIGLASALISVRRAGREAKQNV